MRLLTQLETFRLRTLVSKGVEVALIEPTVTGLQKSIMDATQPFRDFLRQTNAHDYSLQGQGPEHKRQMRSYIITERRAYDSKASLYRPNTKTGDPRIWFSRLGEFCEPNDLVGVIYFRGSLWIFNLTRLDVHSFVDIDGPFKELVDAYTQNGNEIADELLGKLRRIAAKGFIPSSVDADTAVGRLLEAELNIPINSSRKPDYKGIELKAFRSERNNRLNLFAQVPDWQISKYKSSKQLLDAFGYDRDGVRKLYCTVSAQSYNSQGLRLRLNDKSGLLVEFSQVIPSESALVWRMEKLSERLMEKHAETFWIKAEVIRRDKRQWFKYLSVEHTKSPILTQLDVLLNSGDITLDHLIKEKGLSAVEKGPFFKLKHGSLPLLFPPSKEYKL